MTDFHCWLTDTLSDGLSSWQGLNCLLSLQLFVFLTWNVNKLIQEIYLEGERNPANCVFGTFTVVLFCSQLAVANNRIITLQEEMERVKEESSYILESNRKVCVCRWFWNPLGSSSPNLMQSRCSEEIKFRYVSRKSVVSKRVTPGGPSAKGNRWTLAIVNPAWH